MGFYLSTTAILLRFKHMPTNLSYYNILRHVSRDSRRCMRCCWKPIRHCFRYHWYHCLTGISSLPGIAASSWYQGSEIYSKKPRNSAGHLLPATLQVRPSTDRTDRPTVEPSSYGRYGGSRAKCVEAKCNGHCFLDLLNYRRTSQAVTEFVHEC